MLYFMKDGRRLKIGVTDSPKARLATVQTSNPEVCSYLLLMELDNDVEIERMLHDRLAHCVTPARKEWFDVPYATALEHLLAIRSAWHLPGERALALASPQTPRFEDHAVEFENWLREVWLPDGDWNPALLPLPEAWNLYRQHYFDGDKPMRKEEVAATFQRMFVALGEIPVRNV